MTLSVTLKPKECEAPKCGKSFLPRSIGQRVCSWKCAKRLVDTAKKAEKAQDRARKANLKRRRDWIAEAQAAVNRYCRLRDLKAGRGCISCGARPEQKYGGTSDAGHFRSVGSAPHMRFYTTQIRLQCVRCNRHLGGNHVEYRKGFVALIGESRVQEIEAMQGVAKWSVEYLARLKRIFAKRARRIGRSMT